MNSGLVDLFTPLSSGRVNINTASPDVLQVIPASMPSSPRPSPPPAQGEDDGSGLTGPYRSVDQVRRVPEVNLEVARMLAQDRDVQRAAPSRSKSTPSVGAAKRQFIAILGRNNPRDIQVLSFYWK